MAKRMDGTETWFRVRYEVTYDINYRSFNKEWDHTKPTTGDLEGSNPMYIQHEETHEDFYIYLGPYNSLKKLETEAQRFEEGYTGNDDTFRNLVIKRCETETAKWEEV